MNIQTELMAMAINYITEVMEAEHIYCFGSRHLQQQTESVFGDRKGLKRAVHFDLLVVTDNLCPRPDFIGRLENIEGMEVTVCLMVCTRAALDGGLLNNNRFYHTVISKGRLVYGKIGTAPLLPVVFDGERDLGAIRAYRENCAARGAKSVFSTMNYKNIFNFSAIPLYTKSLVEVCREVVYVCMGYEPEGYSLEQLLDLCDSIDPRFNELIPRFTQRDIFHYKVLLKGSWRKGKVNMMEPRMLDLYDCCERFIGHAEAVCARKLEQTVEG
ncbi:hypothetical protein ACSBL2_20600 [Pedobacter sp. AW31-3R]|uniref:hypothetical protein n=1 Tax=Pedobacter sp. AW31-3R TaxID=3445781 RepID=UPI003F9EE8FC